MDITIKNCNCLDEAKIQLDEGMLNIKFAINGTGKTTISKAIQLSIKGNDAIKALTPFKYLGIENAPEPSVTGAEAIKSVAVFDEAYISQIVFKPDEVINNSFEIFIRTPEYDQRMKQIEESFKIVKETLAKNENLDSVINDLRELSSSFGKSASGYSKSGVMHKGIGNGNKLENIPAGLEPYKALLQSTSNVKWLKWQIGGNEFLNISEDCPYCVTPTGEEKKKTILAVGTEFDSKAIEHLNSILKILNSLSGYFSDDTNEKLKIITTNKSTISDEETNYLKEIKENVDILERKLSNLKSLSFFSFNQVDKVVEKLSDYKIKIEFLQKLDSTKTREIVNSINATLEELLKKATDIQKEIGIHRSNVLKTIQEYKKEIDSFLKYAGYKYSVDIENEKDSYKMKLKHVDSPKTLEKGDQYLSYGERNAFSLVLFMYETLRANPDLIVLDDPISSFDRNKKFAILNALFRGKKSFKDKTVLMLTHDLEPIIDVVHSLSGKFGLSSASFLSEEAGKVKEIPITKQDIITFAEVCRLNLASACDDVIGLVYLRRFYEVTGEKNCAYQLISNLLHKREVPLWIESTINRDMTPSEIATATGEITNYHEAFKAFDYQQMLSRLIDDNEMLKIYKAAPCNYERLQVYRIINEGKQLHESQVITKFINEVFHIENEYLMQLNPRKYQTTPNFIIDECNEQLAI